MNLWAMLGNWLLQTQWLLAAPHFVEISAVLGGILLAGMLWPRGCCKQDDLFSRKAL